MINCGADAVICHHTHRYSGIIKHKNKPIILGVGNFLFSIKGIDNKWRTGIIARLNIMSDFITHEIFPVRMIKSWDNVICLKKTKKEKVLCKIKEINNLLLSSEKFREYWKENFLSERRRLNLQLKYRNKFLFKILKRIKFYNPRLNNNLKKLLLNLVRCDSHREKMIAILQDEEGRKQCG